MGWNMTWDSYLAIIVIILTKPGTPHPLQVSPYYNQWRCATKVTVNHSSPHPQELLGTPINRRSKPLGPPAQHHPHRDEAGSSPCTQNGRQVLATSTPMQDNTPAGLVPLHLLGKAMASVLGLALRVAASPSKKPGKPRQRYQVTQGFKKPGMHADMQAGCPTSHSIPCVTQKKSTSQSQADFTL